LKIVLVDNFNRETKSDILIAENVDKFYGVYIIEALNEKYGGDYSSLYFAGKVDEYVLHKWEP